MNTIITKSDYISKTKNRTEKSCVQKMSARSIPIYPTNLATFEENLIFGRPKRPFWTPMAPKHDIKFNAHHYFQPLRIFYVKMVTSERRWTGVHILSLETTLSKFCWQIWYITEAPKGCRVMRHRFNVSSLIFLF